MVSTEDTEIEEIASKGLTKETEEKKEDVESESSLEESFFSQESLYKNDDDFEMRNAVAEMSEEDQRRNEKFRRSVFPKAGMKKLISVLIGQAVNPNIVIAVSGLSKVFVGELIEEAKRVQCEWNETGALLPSHIHEAHRRLCRKTPNMKLRKRMNWM